MSAASTYPVLKRGIDLCFAAVVLVPFAWLLAAIWLVVRLDSAGPAIFAQPRIGKDGKTFTCYKFRTMRQGTPIAGTHEVGAAMVTRSGRWLRRLKLDELPQAWNIVCNEMSLVGPRPCLPSQTALIAARRKRGVLAIKPGITGLAQVNGIDMSDPERLARWDGRYVRNRNFWLDLRLMLATAIGGGRGDRTARPDSQRPSAAA
jgi:lipopolysaccharide/colanic/teichoic acid biosynthesis glycosyltransferase